MGYKGGRLKCFGGGGEIYMVDVGFDGLRFGFCLFFCCVCDYFFCFYIVYFLYVVLGV